VRRPVPAGVPPTAGPAPDRDDDLEDDLDAGSHHGTFLPEMPSLPALPRLSVPDGLRDLAGEWWVRLTWALVWRWCGLGIGMVLLPSAAEVRAAEGKRLIELLAIVAIVLAVAVVCVVRRWFRRPSFLGSLVRLLLTIVVINLAFLLPTGVLMAVMLAGFLGISADAFAAVFWWSRPRAAHHSANAPSG
jgi:hypothetical protein